MKIIFLGPPGSGKGTAASRVAPKFGIPHISTGDLFRKNIKEQTEIGKEAKQYMDDGKLVPDEVVINMLKARLEEDDCQEGFILDGFPRTTPQAEMLDGITEIDVVVNMVVPDKIVIARNSSRVSCSKCGEIYNLRTMPTKLKGVCDKCGGSVVRRPDDEPDVIKKRLNIYKEQTEPLIEFYKKKGLIRDVICDNIDQTPEQTLEDVLKVLEEFSS
ncbi:MAG: adenylate kinase [Candidatus Aenigmarchaeota archaeon]|nr:adenylate kinase [Candidatus Aenigmarchaeota archaeon]